MVLLPVKISLTRQRTNQQILIRQLHLTWLHTLLDGNNSRSICILVSVGWFIFHGIQHMALVALEVFRDTPY